MMRMKKMTLQDLPRELLTQILSRLPVKSLFRFKCVCKSWLSLISDPHFASSHYDLAATRTCKLVLYLPSISEFRSIDPNASLHDASASVLNHSFLPHFPELGNDVQIMCSCRGFLLLRCHSNLYVWNPSTGVHQGIPLGVDSSYSSRGAILFNFSSLYAFGYDPSTDDYLVLRGKSFDSDRGTRVTLYSLRANTLGDIEDTYLSSVTLNTFSIVISRFGSYLNGAIHWLAFRYDVQVNVIVAFDLTERSFSEIPLPDDFVMINNYYASVDLLVFGGFLGLYVGCYNEPTVIWVMKEYKVQSSWTKSIVVSTDEIPTQYFSPGSTNLGVGRYGTNLVQWNDTHTLYFSPLCSTKFGDIVGRYGRTGLVKCDDKGQVKEYRSYFDDPDGLARVAVAAYTESLLSLPGDN